MNDIQDIGARALGSVGGSATPWGAIANIASPIMGILGNMFGNNNQMQQQQALMQQQYANQMGLNNQMAQIQRDNWDYTNYGNQVKHMENAGLNVGLMYGMGGSGGATMGSGSGGSASGGNAPQNMAPAIMDILQRQKMNDAQIELAQAQAGKLRAETPTEGNLGDATRGNVMADTALKNINTDIQKIQKDIQEGGKDYSILNIMASAEKAQAEARSAGTKANVDKATQQTQIDTIKQQYALLGLEAEAKRAGINLSEENKKLVEKEVEYFQRKYELDERKVGATEAFNKNLKEFQESLITQGYIKIGADGLTKIAELALKGRGNISETISEGMKDAEGGYWNKTTTKTK